MQSTLCTLLVSLALATPAWSQQKTDDHSTRHRSTDATASAADDLADAEVRKVDKEGARVTLKHGEIKSLDMPPMTMVFHVKDKAMLDQLKAGDKVRFKAVNEAGKYTVTDIRVNR
jgi:Cu(I)/Ag(I) efflux system periplasmic protein CusF